MSDIYYLNKLYPFQDEVLSGIECLNLDFYLSGDTALSRAYLNHRYSDDLDFFSRVDHWRNILSNKICALTRMEPKDYADILFMAEKYDFYWIEIMDEAKKKDLWVEPIEVSRMIHQFPVKMLTPVKWIQRPDLEKAKRSFLCISEDILRGSHNRLGRP